MNEKPKYIIRRAIIGLASVPFIASIYTIGYSLLVLAGVNPTSTFDGVMVNGVIIGFAVAIVFTFIKQVVRFAAWITE